MFKIGDVVYFDLNQEPMLFTNVGVVIAECNGYYKILNYHVGGFSTMYKLNETQMKPISEKDVIISTIKDIYKDKITKLNAEIKSISRSCYKDEIADKYERLKTEIKNTAKNIYESEDDESFENKLKAICEKKKQIFSIECEGVSDARKFNGRIKYEINELIKEEKRLIDNLERSYERLKSVLDY